MKVRDVTKMRKYLIIIEKANSGYSAYSPDLDGCIATGTSREEVEKNMREKDLEDLKFLVKLKKIKPEK